MGSLLVGDCAPVPSAAAGFMIAAGSIQPDRVPSSRPIYPSSAAVPARSHSSYQPPVADPHPPPSLTPSLSSRRDRVSPSSQDAQRYLPMTDPIPVPAPRPRANSQPVSVNSTSSSTNQILRAQPAADQPVVAPGPHVEPTPPYDSTASYLPLDRPAGGVGIGGGASTSGQSTQMSTGSGTRPATPRCIKVRDLAHIRQLVRDDVTLEGVTRPRSAHGGEDVATRYEIGAMPVTDVIEMVAGLLTKITTTNDRQHEHLHHHLPPAEGTSGLSPQTSSVLSFHGKNVPTITILSYLTRIHRYCPTTYEVFLGLLVYFDRMTERVNFGSLQQQQQQQQQGPSSSNNNNGNRLRPATAAPDRPPTMSRRNHGHSFSNPPSLSTSETPSPDFIPVTPSATASALTTGQFFVVDSFNIHRLIIAGVTCASKFFSDVFYTNSRYAKVGGLPLIELNHLEIQFLILNDFRLSVSVEELDAYGTMLVEFYIREVICPVPTSTSSISGLGSGISKGSSRLVHGSGTVGDVSMSGTGGVGRDGMGGGGGFDTPKPTPP
ncbi:MAG: Proteasome subunit beta type-1 [Watsoniomyces obsoletus]|nr:MAG: Proteasome subunit beta type-1 [Watsoniomyces obsoletus]